MGDLQDKILSHMIDCTSESENTNHISKVLGLSQSTVFESVQLLKKGKYVQTQQEYSRGKRTLTLTDKGVVAALFSGNPKDKIFSYLQRRAPSSDILLLMNIVKDKNDLQTEWIKLFIEYMVSKRPIIDRLDEKKRGELIAALMVGPENNFVDARKIRRFLELDELFWLIVTLRNKIKTTNSVIDQLESEEPNEAKLKSKNRFSQLQPGLFITGLNKDKLDSEITKSSIEILTDTTKEMVFDIQVNQMKLYKALLATDSDLRLRVNKSDSEMSVTPIIKSR